MTTAWAHLPTAEHIDRILGDLMCRPHIWDGEYDIGSKHAADVVRPAWISAMVVAGCMREWVAIDNMTARGPRVGYRTDAWEAATDAIVALLATPDSAYILDLHPDVVRLMAASGNEPAILLEATVRAQAKLKP